MIDLTSVDAFIAYADLEADDDVSIIAALITAYSAYVRQYCNRDFTTAAYSRTFDGQNNTRLLLPQYPITAVASVQVGLQAVPAAAAFGQPGFRFDATSVMLTDYRFCRGEGNVLVNWTAGYDTPPVEIAQAVNELVALRYANRGDKIGWSSKGLANETVSLVQKDMPDSVRTILNNWRAVVPL